MKSCDIFDTHIGSWEGGVGSIDLSRLSLENSTMAMQASSFVCLQTSVEMIMYIPEVVKKSSWPADLLLLPPHFLETVELCFVSGHVSRKHKASLVPWMPSFLRPLLRTSISMRLGDYVY